MRFNLISMFAAVLWMSFLFSLPQAAVARGSRVIDYEDNNSSGGDGNGNSFDRDRYRSSSYSGSGNSRSGRNELASGSTQGGSGFGRYGAMSYVKTGGEYGRGAGIERARLTCPGSGSFTWVNKGSRSCMSMGGSAELFNLIDRSFNKCVAAGAKAAGISSNGGNYSGRVIHNGIEGDSRHQKTRSLHNVGRAIDINSIEVNGVLMDHSQASRQARSNRSGKEYRFFTAFRECWSREVRSACPSAQATRAGYVGSIGCEDSDHQAHMHISLPVCGQRGFKIAVLESRLSAIDAFLSIFVPSALATEPDKDDKIELSVSSGDKVTGVAKFVGEPVTEPVSVTLKIKCQNKAVKVLEERLMVCDYVSFKEDAQTKKMVLTTTASKFNEEDGTVACGPAETKEYENPCAVTKEAEASSPKKEDKKSEPAPAK